MRKRWKRMCVPTVAKDQQLLALPDRHLRQQRQQVVRHALRILAHDAARMAPARVEVPQQRRVPPLHLLRALPRPLVVRPRRRDVVADRGLGGDFRVAVRVGGAERALLGDGDHVGEARGVAVHGRRRGEDDVVDAVARHRAQQAERAVDVGVPVVERALAGLADGLAGCWTMSVNA